MKVNSMHSVLGAQSSVLAPLDSAKMPRHIAIIMDGNGRWAKARSLPRLAGHRAGVESVRAIVKACAELGIPYLTLYSFSTENWLRPKQEVSELMHLLSYALRRETKELHKKNVRLRTIGDTKALPKPVRDQLARSIAALDKNTGIELILALNYGSRQEIVEAANRLIASGATRITEESLSRALDTAGLPDPDLVIRTSGEMRVSNFLLWQIAYAELYVTPLFWPDFRKEHLIAAIADYQRRERRYGGL